MQQDKATPSPPVYKPSYVGRLIHADIVGPFRISIVGHFKYVLVLTDDHSRFKSVFFMKKKSEAIDKVKSYVASLNAHVNKGKATPVQVVGSLHTDNAGEFLSHEFKDFMDEASIRQTTCPPHIHSLNGVAERAKAPSGPSSRTLALTSWRRVRPTVFGPMRWSTPSTYSIAVPVRPIQTDPLLRVDAQ